MESSYQFENLAFSKDDLQYGMAAEAVGMQEVPRGHHPRESSFGNTKDTFKLLYLTQGQGTLLFRSGENIQTEQLLPGHMILLFPGVWHSYGPQEGSGWKVFYLRFHGGLLETRIRSEQFNREHPVYRCGLHDEIVTLFNRAILIAGRQKPGYQTALDGIISNILCLMWFYDKNNDGQQTALSQLTNRAKIYIQDHYRTVRAEDVAEALFMSYSRFRKLFKQQTGVSPAHYIQRVKIGKSKEMLSDSSQSIKEIALDIGFENKDYFSTVFKRITGCTPSHWREHAWKDRPKE